MPLNCAMCQGRVGGAAIQVINNSQQPWLPPWYLFSCHLLVIYLLYHGSWLLSVQSWSARLENQFPSCSAKFTLGHFGFASQRQKGDTSDTSRHSFASDGNERGCEIAPGVSPSQQDMTLNARPPPLLHGGKLRRRGPGRIQAKDWFGQSSQGKVHAVCLSIYRPVKRTWWKGRDMLLMQMVCKFWKRSRDDYSHQEKVGMVRCFS